MTSRVSSNFDENCIEKISVYNPHNCSDDHECDGHLQGFVNATYDELKDIFGNSQPIVFDPWNKVHNEFNLELEIEWCEYFDIDEDESEVAGHPVACDYEQWTETLWVHIYDWKEYHPMVAREEMYQWHIGSEHSYAVTFIQEVIDHYRKTGEVEKHVRLR